MAPSFRPCRTPIWHGAVQDVTIFARIMPEQKLRIVNALKASGAVVAMTGDGVNDAPSLKAADIGVAMGGRGTDVAREAASIVLLDDDFGSIVTTVRLGRRIYDNLRKAMSFILAVHVPIAGLALMPLLFGMPILFGPMHIAFLEMVIDPVCSLVFEAETEEDGVMDRPPRAACRAAVLRRHDPVEPGAGCARAGRDRHDLRAGPRLRAVGTDQVRGLDLCHADPGHRGLDLRGPVAVVFARDRNSAAQPGAGSRAAGGRVCCWPSRCSGSPHAIFSASRHCPPVFMAVPPLAGVTLLLVLETLKPIWRKAAPSA